MSLGGSERCFGAAEGSLPRHVRSIGLCPPRLEQGRNEGQSKGGDEVTGHEGGLELVVWVARKVGRVATELVESVCGEHVGVWV